MVRNGVVVDLDGGLVVFGNEDGFTVGCAVTVGIEGFTNPNVVVIVGVFDGLGGYPRFGCRIIGLLSDGGEAVAVVPSVEFTVRGILLGNAVAFVVVRVRPCAVAG